MGYHTHARGARHSERGISLFIVAVGLFVFLGVCALAIDLAMLYVTRNEAQRAADAAALAAAKAFVDSGFTSGLVTQATACSLATAQAETIGAQNQVGGQPAVIISSDIACDFSAPGDPRITVKVGRIAARGNAMPTFFANAFGILSADIIAYATAEAYNPSSSPTGPTLCESCEKPFVLPNCDPNHPTPANPVCPGGGQGYFIDPNTGAIENPGAFPTGVVGEEWTLHLNATPSQYQVVDVGCGGGDQIPCIAGCTTALSACGSTTTTVQGARVGQIRSAMKALIHAGGNGGPGNGQDTITINADGTWTITGGSNNPNPALVGKTTTTSDSLVTVPLYDGSLFSSGVQTVTIIGYMQVFFEYLDPQGKAGDIPITVRILNVTGCGNRTGTCGTSGGGSSGGTVQGGGGTLLPIRLVRNPGT